MSTEIGAYEAKTRLPEILRRVEAGERFTITNRGIPIADLTPAVARPQTGAAKAIEAMHAIKRVRGVSTAKLLNMINAGRR